MSSTGQTAALSARRSGPLRGRVRAPGDKSVSHRALIFGALAQGVTEVEGLLEGEDVLRSAAAMRAFGAGVEALGEGRWRVTGRGGFVEPEDVIDCGNAGTGVRLILGAAAGFDLAATFTGDASLRGRPMNRVMKPLSEMGARFLHRSGGRLPLTLRGGSLEGIVYRLPEPSAQVKSAILLAGLNDQPQNAAELAQHLRGFQSHVNLIPYNPISEVDYQRPSESSIREFVAQLEARHIAVSVRYSRGLEENAACGQLRASKVA
jgi:3-phosphoshikimate 1-carboxyvinyltransferase